MAADIVCEPARMPPAAPGGSPNILAQTTTRDQAQHAADDRENGELETVLLQAVEKRRTDPQPHPVHEQVVEERLGEVVELQLHPVDRGPGGEGRADDDRRGNHAQAVALDVELADKDRHADREKQQDVGVGFQEFEECLHDDF